MSVHDASADMEAPRVIPVPSFLRSIVTAVLILMAVEVVIMLLLGSFLATLPPAQAALADAALLGLAGAPALWWLVGRPLVQSTAGDAAKMAFQQSMVARSAEQDRAVAMDRLKRTLNQSVGALAQMIDMRDPYTAGHQSRVAMISEAIAREMELPDEQIENIRLGALMHDIGKIAIPSEILTKPGKLIPEEMALVRTHPSMGGDIVGHIEFAPAILSIVTQHHERLDGSGYPLGLKGDAITFEARLVAVADVLEAVTSHRPYRPALGMDSAIEELRSQRGTTLDAAVVDACLRLLSSDRLLLEAVTMH